METVERIDNLEKLNRIKNIRCLLTNIESYVSQSEDLLSEDFDTEIPITDNYISKIVGRVKYDLEILERYL